MNELAEKAILAGLSKRLMGNGSWAGETHVQKSAYLLSELREVDFNFHFILYKHGPYSFELHDELSTMTAEDLLEPLAPSPRYGPRLLVTPRGQELETRLQKTMERYGESLDWIADVIGSRGVVDLERLATAMWVTRQQSDGSVRSRAQALIDLKPHIALDDAIESVEEIDSL